VIERTPSLRLNGSTIPATRRLCKTTNAEDLVVTDATLESQVAVKLGFETTDEICHDASTHENLVRLCLLTQARG
jgi:hypothetical protein